MTEHVVTIGETMAVISTASFGRLEHTDALALKIAGAESNVAIGLQRLGVGATWIGKVGEDSLGHRIVRELRAEGVTVHDRRDPDAATGVILKERRTPHDTRIVYYRRGLAGSRMTPEELDPAVISSASLLHVTGVSPALSVGMAATIWRALDLANESGVPVSFDLNYRSALWARDVAGDFYREVIPRCRIVFAGEDEAAIAIGAGDPESLARRLVEAGAGAAVVKLGARGAIAVVDGKLHQRAAIPVDVVDTVGAGDAFVAGYLAEWVQSADAESCLWTAVRTGASACTGDGDWENALRRDELATFGEGGDPVSR